MAITWRLPPKSENGFLGPLIRHIPSLRHLMSGRDQAARKSSDTEAEFSPAASLATPPDAFEAFFQQNEHQIFGYLQRMLGDEQAAHDLCQETFIRAWQHFDKIRGYQQPASWLFRVASNLALSHLRRRASPVGSAKLIGDDDELSRSDPALHFVEADLIQHILMELTPRQRAALVLREVYGLSCEEIAQALGVSRDAVKMALWRGREQFRARYLAGGKPS